MVIPSQLDEFVNNVMSSTSENDNEKLKTTLEKARDILKKYPEHLDTTLKSLNMSIHSVAVAIVLEVKLKHFTPKSIIINAIWMISFIKDFTNNVDIAVVREHRETFVSVYDYLSKLLVENNNIADELRSRGIYVLKHAIKKVQQAPGQLTVLHSYLAQLSLVCGIYKPVFPILDEDITTISIEKYISSPRMTKHYMLYFYYGGLIYLTQKEYRRASLFFEAAYSLPAQMASHIMIEACKKNMLVLCILSEKGKTWDDTDGDRAPRALSAKKAGALTINTKYMPVVLLRALKGFCHQYYDVVSAFDAGNSIALKDAIKKHEKNIKKDRNMGIVKQVVIALKKKNIQKLTRSYIVLSLQQIAEKCDLSSIAEAERLIVQMVKENRIYAKIQGDNGLVEFADRPKGIIDPSVRKSFMDGTAKVLRMAEEICKEEQRIETNPSFVKKVVSSMEEDSKAIPPQS